MSGDGLEVRELPGAVEGGWFGSVDAEVDEPSGAGLRLDPSSGGVVVGWWFGSEVQGDGLVGGDVGELEHRAQRGEVLVRGDLAAGFRVIDGDRPEQLGRDWLRHGER